MYSKSSFLRSFFIISIFLFAIIGCNNAQENTGNDSTAKDSSDSIVKEVLNVNYCKVLDKEDILLNELENSSGQNEKTATYIDKRIEDLIGSSMESWCEEQNVTYPPKFVLFRVFKYDEEYEVWAGNSNKDTLKLIQTFQICAMDTYPGPKSQQGDGKTPEGFYTCSNLYGSSYGFMWIKLNNDEVDTYGSVGRGSSFKLYVNYPNSIDKARTAKYKPGKNTGGDICIHGNCVSAGCISFKNRVFLPVYAFQKKHKANLYGNIQIHIFPYRFDKHDMDSFLNDYQALPKEYLKEFWTNLKEGYDKFNASHVAIKVTRSGSKYIFN